jgi:hypothetical protein
MPESLFQKLLPDSYIRQWWSGFVNPGELLKHFTEVLQTGADYLWT